MHTSNATPAGIALEHGNGAPIIFIEFNELSPTLMLELMRAGRLPNFSRFYAASTVYVTDAGQTDHRLQPWIAWPSVHTGAPYSDHGAYLLGDAAKIQLPLLGEILSHAGIKSGIFGSMNMPYQRLTGFCFPDPWATNALVRPARLQAFYDVIAAQVQEAAQHGRLGPRECAALLTTLLRNGLSLQTVGVIVKQLRSERATRGGTRWRRASVLDSLLYDVFRRLCRTDAIGFASFFSNSTAHYQHYYWRNMRPAQFTVKPAATDHPSLTDAIPYGYVAMDRLVGRMMRDFPQHVLLLCTALSQHPHTAAVGQGVRPRSFADFLRFAGIGLPDSAIKPVMAEQFHVVCPDQDVARMVEARFAALMLGNSPLMAYRREGANVFAGARWIDVDDLATLDLAGLDVTNAAGERRRLMDLFVPLPGQRSGTHHPDGIFWVRNGRHVVVSERLPIEAIAPSILNHFAVAAPESMHAAPIDLTSLTNIHTGHR